MGYSRFLIALFIISVGCSTSKPVSESSNEHYFQSGRDLTEHIQDLPGVVVLGNGATATISMRGAEQSTFYGNFSPLFVVNSRVIGQNYEQVYNMVVVNEIKSITVLKGPDATQYGSRGAYGVIVIDTL